MIWTLSLIYNSPSRLNNVPKITTKTVITFSFIVYKICLTLLKDYFYLFGFFYFDPIARWYGKLDKVTFFQNKERKFYLKVGGEWA